MLSEPWFPHLYDGDTAILPHKVVVRTNLEKAHEMPNTRDVTKFFLPPILKQWTAANRVL